MIPTETDVKRLVDELRTQRELLRVRIHLAGADARDEWNALEKRWRHLRGRADVIGREAASTAEHVVAALAHAADELKQGYHRLQALL
jgi:hypothetical protein